MFFFNDRSTPDIYTLSLHDPLPISADLVAEPHRRGLEGGGGASEGRRLPDGPGSDGDAELQRAADRQVLGLGREDPKSTRLNSSHANISYAVFCLNNKK